MKIAQVVQSLEIGGMERLTVDLAIAQRDAGHEPSIYCIFERGKLAEEAEQAGIPVHCYGKATGFSLNTTWQLRQDLRREGIDVVQTHNSRVHHYGVLAARLAGVPVVVNTLHGYGILHTNRRSDQIYRATLPWTDRVVMVSPATLEYFEREKGVPASKSQVILNGIPLDKFAGLQASPGSRRPVIRFGTVGRMAPAKDHVTLIKAYKKVLETLPDAELHIVGDGWIRDVVEKCIDDLDLRSRITLHGAQLNVGAYLQTFDIFVLSSVTEGLPVAALEAMAVGLPVVATKIAGVPEVAPEHTVAFLCPPSQPEALAAAMVRMATEADLQTMGQNAHEWAWQRFGIAPMWRQYEQLYREIYARKRPQARQETSERPHA